MKKSIMTVWLFSLALLCGIVLGNNITTLSTSIVGERNYKVTDEELEDGLNYLVDFNKVLNEMNPNEDVDILKIKIANELYELSNTSYNNSQVEFLVQKLLSVLASDFESGKSLLSSLSSVLSNLITDFDSLTNQGLTPDGNVRINAETAGKEVGKEYDVGLNGYIYYANEKSDKWVILVHGYMMNGKLIANSLAEMYIAKGYNVLAPDLRGFGKSGGSVAMGYLESLDIWDWLTYINDDNNLAIGDRVASEVIIHGVSLGGATTLQLWSQKDMGRDLVAQHVIGLVNDSGYSSMTSVVEELLSTKSGKELLSSIIQIDDKEKIDELLHKENIDELLINGIDTGIEKNDFEILQDSLSVNRVTSDIPIYIIHGMDDKIVPYSMTSAKVFSTAMSNGLLYDFWQVENMPHAFIIAGIEKERYQTNLYNFIDFVEERVDNKKFIVENEENSVDEFINDSLNFALSS